MPSHFDVRGASGTFYRFRPADDPRARSSMSGNYVYVREGDGEVVYLGEADNLMEGCAARFREASAGYGASAIYIRPIVARATRAEEQQDILEAVVPPMNEAPLRAARPDAEEQPGLI